MKLTETEAELLASIAAHPRDWRRLARPTPLSVVADLSWLHGLGLIRYVGDVIEVTETGRLVLDEF